MVASVPLPAAVVAPAGGYRMAREISSADVFEVVDFLFYSSGFYKLFKVSTCTLFLIFIFD